MGTTTTTPVVTIVKDWDGNERITEGRNGRTYVSAGRWQWIILIDGKVDSVHNTQREAKTMLANNDECPQCSKIGRGPLCKVHATACTCGTVEGNKVCPVADHLPADDDQPTALVLPATVPSVGIKGATVDERAAILADALRACTGSVQVTVTDGQRVAVSRRQDGGQ